MIFLIIFILFLGLVFFLSQNQKQQIQKIVESGNENSPLKNVAQELGLHFENIKSDETQNIFSQGSRVWGQYQGIPIEMVFKGESSTHAGVMGTYSYAIQKTISFTVKNKNKKSFDILPRQASEGGNLTGNERFDTHLRLIGDNIIPSDILDYFGSLGWMHLTLKDDKLTFHDTFYEQFHGVTGSTKMLETVHPIWKTSLQSGHIQIEELKKFLDTLVKFIYHENLQ